MGVLKSWALPIIVLSHSATEFSIRTLHSLIFPSVYHSLSQLHTHKHISKLRLDLKHIQKLSTIILRISLYLWKENVTI